SYNIINYMLPGVVFSVLSKNWLAYNFINENILLEIFIVYFIGIVISRISSIIIEPLLKRIKFVKFAPYEDYVKLESKNQKLKILNEQNNMFRTLFTTIVLLALLKLYQFLSVKFCFLQYNYIVLIVSLLVLFLFSYRKQTNFIRRRVEISKGADHETGNI
ncbi:hypothetical protein, partial [Treponema sp. R6D11]